MSAVYLYSLVDIVTDLLKALIYGARNKPLLGKHVANNIGAVFSM
jgi:hypothetical protein